MSFEHMEIGPHVLYHGDCADVLPYLDGVAAVVTDPPYGIGEHGGRFRDRKGRGNHTVLPNKGWDKQRPPRAVFDKLLALSSTQIIWGGQHFSDVLPQSRGWLYWDKLMGGDFGDGDLAWTSLSQPIKKFTYCPKRPGNQHPTQKPVPLMVWCLQFLPSMGVVLDPFMGSGSTLVAACRTGHPCIGIERDRDYFDIACTRVAEALGEVPGAAAKGEFDLFGGAHE